MSSTPKPQIDSGRQELLKSQLEMYLDAYKHHYELFLKGMFLYLAAIGAVAAYMFREVVSAQLREILSGVISLGSLLCLVGCVNSYRWVNLIEARIDQICSELNVVNFPFRGARHVTLEMSGVAALLSITSLVFLLLLRYHAIA